MKITRFSLFLVASTSIFALLTVTSCKKSNNNSSSNGISATVSGTGFNPSVTVADYSSGGQWWEITGFYIKTGDTSVVDVGFSKNFPNGNPQFVVGKSFTTDTTSAYVDYYTTGASAKTYDASNGDGFATFTVTSLDTTGHKISGTFSGTLYNGSSDSIVVTNGKFNTAYTVLP